MANIALFKEEHPEGWDRLKASIRTRISVWIGLAAIVGWMFHVFLSKGGELMHRGVTETPQIIIQERSRPLPSPNNQKAEVACCHWR